MIDARGQLKRVSFVAYAIAFATAMTGGLLTEIGPWYYALRKPAWQPPDWLFGPVWTLIFGLSALSGILAWRSAHHWRRRYRLLGLFLANAGLNVGWSLLFFKLQRPDHALVEVGGLWLSVLVLMAYSARWNMRAALLLAPYLGWVSFAAFLNYTIVQLNAPFGAP